jgi:hypothetical protein
LEGEEGTIFGLNELKTYVVNFYKRLFGSSRHSGVHMSSTFWSSEEQQNEMDRIRLNHIKQEIMKMVGDFNEAKLDLQRLNHGVTNTITQYRPI